MNVDQQFNEALKHCNNMDQVLDCVQKYYALDRPYRDWETDRKSTRLNSSHRL